MKRCSIFNKSIYVILSRHCPASPSLPSAFPISLPGRSLPSGSGGPSTSLSSAFTPRSLAAALTGGGSGALRGKVSAWDGEVRPDGDLREMVNLQREHKAARRSGRGLRPSVDAAASRRRCAAASLRRAWRRAGSPGQDLAEADLV
jgi:hypothetical protein